MLKNYICALDIGSSKIAGCVAQVNRKQISNIVFDSAPSKGIREGIIVDSIDLTNCISGLMKRLKHKSGLNIKSLCTNISGRDIVTKKSRAINPLAERGNKVITLSDIQKVNEQARILGSSLEEEIIHLVPSGYSIDSKNDIANPLGLYSHKLEVDLYLICGKLSSIQSLNRVINQSGYEIKDLFFSGLATSRVVFDKELREGINLFCDIGSDTTELLIFKDGTLRDVEILSQGGNDLTLALKDALRVPFELAEDIKRAYAIIGASQQIGEDKEILVKQGTDYKTIKQRLVSEIISVKSEVICSSIKEAVEKKTSCHEVKSFVTAGRTVLIEGFIETLENILRIPVKLGRINNSDINYCLKDNSALSGQNYLTYLTALGIICEALQEKKSSISPGGQDQAPKNLLSKTINKLKEVYQEYF